VNVARRVKIVKGKLVDLGPMGGPGRRQRVRVIVHEKAPELPQWTKKAWKIVGTYKTKPPVTTDKGDVIRALTAYARKLIARDGLYQWEAAKRAAERFKSLGGVLRKKDGEGIDVARRIYNKLRNMR
jgi:hypothetical protein